MCGEDWSKGSEGWGNNVFPALPQSWESKGASWAAPHGKGPQGSWEVWGLGGIIAAGDPSGHLGAASTKAGPVAPLAPTAALSDNPTLAAGMGLASSDPWAAAAAGQQQQQQQQQQEQQQHTAGKQGTYQGSAEKDAPSLDARSTNGLEDLPDFTDIEAAEADGKKRKDAEEADGNTGTQAKRSKSGL